MIASQWQQNSVVRMSNAIPITFETNDLQPVLQSIYGDDAIHLWGSSQEISLGREAQNGNNTGTFRYQVNLK